MKTWLVLKHEMGTLMRKPAYLILAFGIPLAGILFLIGVNLIRSGDAAEADPAEEPKELQTEGYVDLAGVISELPDDLPTSILVAFDSEQDVELALDQGQIEAYYVIPTDFLQTGELIYVHPSMNPLASETQQWMMRRAIRYNLVGRDPELLDLILDPMQVEEIDLSASGAGDQGDCARPGTECEGNVLIAMMPMIAMVFFFIALTNGSVLLLRSISGEKQNRLIEVLTSSVEPLQLMTGKILGLGAVTLLAFSVWILGAFVAMWVSQPNLPAEFKLPGMLLPWAIVFFLLGFALYASLMAGIGALVPNMKETTKASWLVIGPMMVGYMIGIFAMERPHSPLMTALSLFPLTSPLNMVQRLTTGEVPFWQPALAVVLLIIAVYFALRFAGRLFRAQHLLSGQPFSPRQVLRAFRS